MRSARRLAAPSVLTQSSPSPSAIASAKLNMGVIQAESVKSKSIGDLSQNSLQPNLQGRLPKRFKPQRFEPGWPSLRETTLCKPHPAGSSSGHSRMDCAFGGGGDLSKCECLLHWRIGLECEPLSFDRPRYRQRSATALQQGWRFTAPGSLA
jgi:hypothetical protein